MSVAGIVREERQRAGLTQAALASACGTSQPAIARYETGQVMPRADTLERILAACGRELGTRRGARRGEHVPARGPRGRLLRRKRGSVLAAVALTGLRNARVFGSVARGEDRPGSDIDILVDLEDAGDVLAIYDLRELLQPILGAGVDVTCPQLLRPEVLREALRDAVAL